MKIFIIIIAKDENLFLVCYCICILRRYNRDEKCNWSPCIWMCVKVRKDCNFFHKVHKGTINYNNDYFFVTQITLHTSKAVIIALSEMWKKSINKFHYENICKVPLQMTMIASRQFIWFHVWIMTIIEKFCSAMLSNWFLALFVKIFY